MQNLSMITSAPIRDGIPHVGWHEPQKTSSLPHLATRSQNYASQGKLWLSLRTWEITLDKVIAETDVTLRSPLDHHLLKIKTEHNLFTIICNAYDSS